MYCNKRRRLNVMYSDLMKYGGFEATCEMGGMGSPLPRLDVL